VAERTQLAPPPSAPSMATGPPTSAAARATSSYTELVQLVRDSGLMSRRYTYYWVQLCAGALALAGLVVAAVWLGNSWFQLIVAGLVGCVLSQFGFLGHDAAHRQIFKSAAWNDWTARLVSGAVLGLSYGWWRGKHNSHHAAPNQVGRDPDISSGLLAFTQDLAVQRTGLAQWFTRRQGWLLFPLLTLEGLSLHVGALRHMFSSRDKHRALEVAMVILRLGGLVALLVLLLPLGKAAAFLGVQVAVFGFLLGGSFIPNHTGMPIVPRGARIDFLNRQVLMSRNIRGNALVDAAMGGLNYQIEHHLFPSMPRPHLKLVRPVVREYCADRDVTYTEVGFFASYAAVVDYLNNVGLGGRNRFDCPLATQLRN
jgi:fatty acid desaturase